MRLVKGAEEAHLDTAPSPRLERRRPGGSRRERPPADLPVVPAAALLSRDDADGVQSRAGVSPAQAAPWARLGGLIAGRLPDPPSGGHAIGRPGQARRAALPSQRSSPLIPAPSFRLRARAAGRTEITSPARGHGEPPGRRRSDHRIPADGDSGFAGAAKALPVCGGYPRCATDAGFRGRENQAIALAVSLGRVRPPWSARTSHQPSGHRWANLRGPATTALQRRVRAWDAQIRLPFLLPLVPAVPAAHRAGFRGNFA